MKNDVKASLMLAGAMLAVALSATLVRRLGFVDSDTVTRVVIGLNGLMIIWYGNRMPKAFVPNVRARQVKRVGGWALVLSGTVYAALFAFAPIPLALTFGSAAVIAGIAVTLGYCLSLRIRAKTA
ncbi:ammonium transporter [Sphingomonas sp. CARO-RG-8B-R24-01]|uniref:ammonium transporter n=1 Tax=Sphingomonas sp. CARO-RG-8B-R24-01 TaxID=2914831 RepID=UPI001F59383B|nr:ammonium transporter [Sphingomonas sp. CARO-RG-8B-R24-01]